MVRGEPGWEIVPEVKPRAHRHYRLHPHQEAEVGTTKVGEGHAWVEVWLSQWWPMDPTNGQPVGQRHVVIGRARDYGDVSPLKGVYRGSPSENLAVSMELTRLA